MALTLTSFYGSPGVFWCLLLTCDCREVDVSQLEMMVYEQYLLINLGLAIACLRFITIFYWMCFDLFINYLLFKFIYNASVKQWMK